jgi:hypothetical protein
MARRIIVKYTFETVFGSFLPFATCHTVPISNDLSPSVLFGKYFTLCNTIKLLFFHLDFFLNSL